MLSDIRPAIVSTILLTLLLGLGYPLAITGIAELAFPYQASGSLVTDKAGHVIGSALIAQPLRQGRVPAPAPVGGRATATTRPAPAARTTARSTPTSPSASPATRRRCASRPASRQIPDDAITTSGSGLDPDISPAYADLQADAHRQGARRLGRCGDAS